MKSIHCCCVDLSFVSPEPEWISVVRLTGAKIKRVYSGEQFAELLLVIEGNTLLALWFSRHRQSMEGKLSDMQNSSL